MSGHSKWATIKRKKGAADAKRGQLFSKLSRAIIVAAKEGGGDPESNATLANAIQKARDASMPKDNIERAIQRGAGSGDGEAYEAILYEGYGPGGVAIICNILTDNRNRAASDVRYIFTKNGGALGTPGQRRLAVRPQGHHPDRRRGGRRGRAHGAGARGGRRGHRRGRRPVAGHDRPDRADGGASRARRGGHRVRLGRADDGPQDHRRTRTRRRPASSCA